MISKSKTIFLNQKIHCLISSGIFLLALLSLIYFFYHLFNIKKDTPTAVYGVDLIAYYTAAKLADAGEISEIYAEVKEDFSVVNSGKFFETAKNSGFQTTPTRYIYLPIFLAPFKLLTSFNFATVATLWLLLNLIIIIGVIALEWYFTKDLMHPLLRLMLIIPLNLFSFPLFYALKLGQTTLIIYLIICLIYYFTLQGHDGIAGILLGLIVALKFSPLLFTLYFLYRKRYVLAISCLITIATLILLSIIAYGLPLHKIYWHYLTSLSSLGIAGWSNQSLEAFLLRQFTESNALYFHPLKVSKFLSILKNILAIAIIVIIYLSLRKNSGRNYQILYSLEFSAIILCFLVIPSISWLHYFTLATIPAIIITVACLRLNGRIKRITLFLTLIGYGMIAFHPNYHSLVAHFSQPFLIRLLISLPFSGSCLLLLINLLLIKMDTK